MSRPPVEPGPGEKLLPQAGIVITPSNINVWRATRGEDELFSWSQLRAMAAAGMDPATCDYIVVRSSLSMAEWDWPEGEKAPVYLLPCPVVPEERPRPDGRVRVISPYGTRELVWPDGHIRRPRAPVRRSAWRAG